MGNICEYIISTLLVFKDGVYQVHRYNTRKQFLDKHPEIKQYLDSKYGYCESIQEQLYCLIHNINEKPKCYCGNCVKFKSFPYGYYKFCSRKCSENSVEVRDKIKNTMDFRYGKDRRLILDKFKQTCIAKYGCENPMQNENIKQKSKETNINRYGVTCTLHNDKVKEKVKKTCLLLYGFENPMQNENIRQKAYNTNISRYGYKFATKNDMVKEKTKHTNILRYGVENVFQNESIKNKIRNTTLLHYGVCYYSQTQDFSDIIRNKSVFIQQRIYNTKKRNNSFHISEPEKLCYDYLISKYPDIIYQYKSEEYPFNCDFYIPSKNLYIELNIHWTHGGHPFDETNINDIMVLEKWKSKNSKFYNMAINTWTVRDPYKRKIAMKHNLNYLEIWSLKNIEDIL